MAPYVLVVESDPELQRRIGETLREASYELAAEAEGAWAKRSLLVRAPDALIVDTTLADGTGFSVANELRRDADTRDVPIFFVASSHRGAAHETEARRRFAPAEYLPTPLDVNTLLARVLEAVPPGAPVSRPAPAAPADAALADTAQRQEKRRVEQDARAFTAADAELSGSLQKQPFARLLQRIYAKRLSGALLVVQGETKKIVYFSDGYPVSVRSNVLGECLGQILLSRNLISQEALNESLQRMKAEKKQQGAVLIEMGLVSPYRLERALTEQMEAKLFDLCAWRTGSFTFKEGQALPGEAVSLDRPTAALILEGIRRHYDDERLEAVLAPYRGQFVVPSSDPLRRMQDITAEVNERAFIDAIDGTQKLEALLAAPGILVDKARLLLVAMSEAGMIEPSRAAVRAGAEARRAAEAALRPPKSRSELAALLEAKKAETLFEVLGLAETATEAQVDAAYERLAREFHPDRYRARSESARELAQRIFDRLGEAQSVLRDPARRRSYVARMDKRDGDHGDRSRAGVRDGADTAAEQVYYGGVEHLRARRYTQAVEAFRQATSLSPGQAGYHGALGWALYRQSPTEGRAVDAGLAELERAVSLDEKDPWLRVSVGRFYAETGRPEAAIASFEAALHLDPNLTDIDEEMRRLKGQS